MNNTDTRELTLPEAARLLKVSWPVAWRLVLRGDLQGHKDGRTWVVSAADVERLASERSREPVSA